MKAERARPPRCPVSNRWSATGLLSLTLAPVSAGVFSLSSSDNRAAHSFAKGNDSVRLAAEHTEASASSSFFLTTGFFANARRRRGRCRKIRTSRRPAAGGSYNEVTPLSRRGLTLSAVTAGAIQCRFAACSAPDARNPSAPSAAQVQSAGPGPTDTVPAPILNFPMST